MGKLTPLSMFMENLVFCMDTFGNCVIFQKVYFQTCSLY